MTYSNVDYRAFTENGPRKLSKTWVSKALRHVPD